MEQVKIVINGHEFIRDAKDVTTGLIKPGEGRFHLIPLFATHRTKIGEVEMNPNLPTGCKDGLGDIEPRRFSPPDLTDMHLPEVEKAWEEANQHRGRINNEAWEEAKQHRCGINKKAWEERNLSWLWTLRDFKAGPAVELIWRQHGTEEIARQEGYDPDDAFEGPLLLMNGIPEAELDRVRFVVEDEDADKLLYCAFKQLSPCIVATAPADEPAKSKRPGRKPKCTEHQRQEISKKFREYRNNDSMNAIEAAGAVLQWMPLPKKLEGLECNTSLSKDTIIRIAADPKYR